VVTLSCLDLQSLWPSTVTKSNSVAVVVVVAAAVTNCGGKALGKEK
jgi:hypothetical protein